MAYKLNNIAVLVVDSNHNHMQLIKEVLRPLGVVRIAESVNAKEALAYLDNNVVDIIFTEWHMDGDMDGIGFVEWVRKNPASRNVFVPIIMVTAQSEEWKVMKARDAGVTEFLVKPFTAKAMARRITMVIEYPRQFVRSEEHTSELQSLMRISYAVFCLKKKNKIASERDKRLHKSQTKRRQ